MVAKRILYKRIKWSCDQFPTSENPRCRGPYLLPAHLNLLQFNTVIAKSSMFEAMTALSSYTLPARYHFASADRGEPGTFTGETTFPPWSSLCSLVAKNELRRGNESPGTYPSHTRMWAYGTNLLHLSL